MLSTLVSTLHNVDVSGKMPEEEKQCIIYSTVVTAGLWIGNGDGFIASISGSRKGMEIHCRIGGNTNFDTPR